MSDMNNLDDVVSELEGSSPHIIQSRVTAACAREICSTINELTKQPDNNAKASDKLRDQILYLNVLLFIATAVGAIATWKSVFESSGLTILTMSLVAGFLFWHFIWKPRNEKHTPQDTNSN